MTPRSIGVVGGGVIGLAVAWECARRGHRVTVYDPSAGSGASHVAAGMLAPVSEAYFGEQPLTAMLLESARRWPAFAAELARASGRDVGYRDEGTLQVGVTGDDLAELSRLWRHQASLGQPVTALTGDQLREREPLLHPRARGVLVPGDHQVDPRLVLAALRTLVEIRPVRVGALSDVDDDVVVLAAGTACAELAGLPVRPVKGVLLRLRGPVVLRHVVRGHADGRPVYLVPRRDGEVLVGATVEERADHLASAGAVRELLHAATDLVPELAEHTLTEVSVGHRPATPDNAPLIGPLDALHTRQGQGLIVATGHHRHGVLAAPLTAAAVAGHLDGEPLEVCEPFSPHRFAERHFRPAMPGLPQPLRR